MKNKITPWDILNYSLQNIFFKGIEVDIAGVQKSEETIANFQWFLRRPSPLNVFGRSDHCHQWFYDGFLMLLPSLSMVFDGSGPLVKRCDGFDGSLWSTAWILPDYQRGTKVLPSEISAMQKRGVMKWPKFNFFLLLDNHLSLVSHFWRAESNTTLWFDS